MVGGGKYKIELVKEDNLLSLNYLKEFVSVPFFIPWYKSKESNKVFPIIIQEIGDINPIKRNKLADLIIGYNPFFEHVKNKDYIIITKDSKPVGRIFAFVDDSYNKENNSNTGWIGMFESIEEKDVANRLLDVAVIYLKSQGCKEILGPAKFNANGEIGLLIDGFENKPYFMEPYNPPYYQEFFEDFGFEKVNDWYSVVANKETFEGYLSKIERLNKKLKNSKRGKEISNLNFRNAELKNAEEEINKIKGIYNSEWAKGHHPQFVKMTDNEFNYLAKGLKDIALEELIFIVEEDNKPIGVAVTLPNINEVIAEYDSKLKDYKPSRNIMNLKDIKRDSSIYFNIKSRLKQKRFDSARILILGVKEEYRKKGIESMLYHKTASALQNIGVKEGSASQLADINLDIVNPLKKMGKKAFTWRVYGLKL